MAKTAKIDARERPPSQLARDDLGFLLAKARRRVGTTTADAVTDALRRLAQLE